MIIDVRYWLNVFSWKSLISTLSTNELTNKTEIIKGN